MEPDLPPDQLRVLFSCFSRSSLGHVVRSTAAAAELNRRGHSVMFGCSAQAAHVPKGAGIPWAEISEIEPAPAWRAITSDSDMRALARTRLASPAYLARCLADEGALIARFHPDIVISDMRNTAGVAASLAGVPSISIHNIGLFISPLNVILPAVLETLAELGIPEPHRRKALGDVMAVPGLSLFEPVAELPPEAASLIRTLPREIRYVGPMLAKHPADLPDRRTLRARYGRPDGILISVTLGGSAGGAAQLGEIIEGLGGLDADLVLTTGPGIDAADIRSVAARFERASPRSRVTLSQYREDALELMKACDAAVVHGGHSTAMEGLLCGTPMVFVPHAREQAENARALAAHGLGLVAPAGNIGAVIRPLVGESVTPQMRARCATFADRMRRVRGSAALADFVETHMLGPAVRALAGAS